MLGAGQRAHLFTPTDHEAPVVVVFLAVMVGLSHPGPRGLRAAGIVLAIAFTLWLGAVSPAATAVVLLVGTHA